MYTRKSESELYHFGIKGMKWGVRRYQNKDGTLTPAGKRKQAKEEAKASKKEVDKFYKDLRESGQNSKLASMTALSKFNPKDYEKAATLIDQGRLLVKARFEKNYKERSIDVYFDTDKNPTVRAQLVDGENFTAKFIDKASETNFNEFAKYYNSRN